MKLYLALEDRDQGYSVAHTEASKQELEAWFNADPDRMIGFAIGVVEPKQPMIEAHWEPVTVMPSQWKNGGWKALAPATMTIEQMKAWAAQEGAKHKFWRLSKTNWVWYLYLAESEREIGVIGGKFESICFRPMTIWINDAQTTV